MHHSNTHAETLGSKNPKRKERLLTESIALAERPRTPNRSDVLRHPRLHRLQGRSTLKWHPRWRCSEVAASYTRNNSVLGLHNLKEGRRYDHAKSLMKEAPFFDNYDSRE